MHTETGTSAGARQTALNGPLHRVFDRNFLLLLLAFAVGGCVLAVSSGWGVDVYGRRLLASFAAIVVIWATGCLSLPVSCLFLLVMMTFSITDFSGAGGAGMSAALRKSLGGFAGLVPITIVAGTAFAAVTRSSGLAERLVYLIMKLVAGKSGGATPARVLGAFFLADLPASIMIPSAVGRTAMFMSIVEGFEKPFKFGRIDSGAPVNPFQKAVWITVSLVTLIMGGAFLTGAGLTIMVGGIIEETTKLPQYWGASFATLYLPALIVMFLCWFILLRLFPSTVKRVDVAFINDELRRLGPLTYNEKYCLATFLGMVALFLTDSWHKIPPPMVLVLSSATLFLPGIGAGSWKREGRHIGWDGFFIIGITLGFSTLLTQYKVMAFIASRVSLLNIGSYLVALLVMIGITLAVRLGMASITASAALIVPVALAVGQAAGLSTYEVACLGWITYIVCRLTIFLPHQSVEMLMTFGMNGYGKNDLARAAAYITPAVLGVYLVWGLFFMPRILALLV